MTVRSAVVRGLVPAAIALHALVAAAAPFTPASDSEVVERLPATASDPAVRRVDSLRKQLAARPGDSALRLDIARRYFEMAMAQGDPRYIGYASATLAPVEKAEPGNASYWLLHGLLQQYSHDFEGAVASLDKASQLDPQAAEPAAWRAAIAMVQARYPQARAECAKLATLATPLLAQGCSTYVQAATGELPAAYESLTKAFAAAPPVVPELALWIDTRLAEMAIRLQRPAEAEAHFKDALRQNVTDQFLLGAYSDFLLQQRRPQEVIALLKDWERSDILLLRLALAGKATGDSRAANWAAQLRDRFDAAAQRGDRLHEQEAARFELDVEGHPDKALAYASRNYTQQKEPRDAEILMRAALAAGQPKAGQPALDWLRESRYEDPAMLALASQLAAKGASQLPAKGASQLPAKGASK